MKWTLFAALLAPALLSCGTTSEKLQTMGVRGELSGDYSEIARCTHFALRTHGFGPFKVGMPPLIQQYPERRMAEVFSTAGPGDYAYLIELRDTGVGRAAYIIGQRSFSINMTDDLIGIMERCARQS